MEYKAKRISLIVIWSLLGCGLVAVVESYGITRDSAAQMAQMAAMASSAAASTVKANGTEARAGGYPAAYYLQHQQAAAAGAHPTVDERDPRQWMTGYGGGGGGYGGGYGSPMFGLGGGSEMLLTCLLVVLGIGVIGLPFLLLIFSTFTGGQGMNFIPPTTTTTVAGRKKREILRAMFPGVNGHVQEKLVDILDNFYKSSDKMEYIKKLIDS